MIDRKLRKIRAGKFCEVDIGVLEGRLSVSGTCGRVCTEAAAKKEALNYWERFFEDNPSEEMQMSRKFDRRFKSPRHAAKFVVESDGDFHGLDVVATVGKKVLIGEGFGQITEEIRKWFPKVAPLLPWHLNDMRAGCEHQRKLKWGHGKVIALAPDTLTEAQRKAIDNDISTRRSEAVKLETTRLRAALLRMSAGRLRDWVVVKSNNKQPSVQDVEEVRSWLDGSYRPWSAAVSNGAKYAAWVKADVERAVKVEKFEGALYKDCLGAPCPECGYKYGTAWVMEPLPLKIVQLAASVYKELEVGGGT